MLQDIEQLMNVKIRKEEVNYKDKNAADMHDVDISELRTFIELLFYTAVLRSTMRV
jgi:hypothetical protein